MYCRDCDYPLKQLTDPRCPECGRGFDVGVPKSYLKRKRCGPLSVWTSRICMTALSANLAWIFMVCWHLRVSTVGSDIYPSIGQAIEFWVVVCSYSVIVGGAFLIPLWWLGTNKKYRRVLMSSIVLCLLLTPVAAEGVAWFEEHLFVLKCKNNPTALSTYGNDLYDNRWWPNGENLLFYNPAKGELIDGN